MSLSKIDLYYMTTAVLSVWKESYPADYYSVVTIDEDDEMMVHVIDHDDSIIELILNIFKSEKSYENGFIYMTKTPTKEFVEACKVKSIEKIVYLPTSRYTGIVDGVQLIPFVSTFGKIIDVLSQYKHSII